MYKAYCSECFALLELLVILTQCLNYNVCHKFRYLTWGTREGMRSTYLPFSLSAKERFKPGPQFGTCSDQKSNNAKPAFSGDHHQFFLPWWCLRRSKWNTSKLFGENTCKEGSMPWTTTVQKHLHSLPCSSEEGATGLIQLSSCPSPPAAGTPCSVCHQSSFCSRAPWLLLHVCAVMCWALWSKSQRLRAFATGASQTCLSTCFTQLAAKHY